MDCFKIEEQQHCCHCYSSSYQENTFDYGLENKFFICPGTHCTINSCAEYLNEETDEYNSECCCNAINNPPCHDCSVLFCPIALALDIVCLLPRCFISNRGCGNKCCKCTIQKCRLRNQVNKEEKNENDCNNENKQETITTQP